MTTQTLNNYGVCHHQEILSSDVFGLWSITASRSGLLRAELASLYVDHGASLCIQNHLAILSVASFIGSFSLDWVSFVET